MKKSNEQKGDECAQKNKYQKALEHYQKQLEGHGPTITLYEKMIAIHEKLTDQWTEIDFAKNLEWTMKKQELLEPSLKRVHAKLEPEWKEISGLILRMMRETDEKMETDLVEQIVGYGEKAIYPLIETLLPLKKIQKEILKPSHPF